MIYSSKGIIIKGVGGLYEIKLSDGENNPLARQHVYCRARGLLRYNGISPLVGDNVMLSYEDSSFSLDENGNALPSKDGRDIIISEILPRKNALIRPPVANIDYMFAVMATASPSPVLETFDKLISIAEFNNIEPIIIIGKSDLDGEKADSLAKIYKSAGYTVFITNRFDAASTDAVRRFTETQLKNKITVFAGASGVGKSTLLNSLFPALHLETGEVSKKTERGKHTTRHVELYPLSKDEDGGYIADTPGFTMIDFEHFDFFEQKDLVYTMREFRDKIGKCKYTKCSHTKEEGCAILAALERGEIAKSRHESYVSMLNTLKAKPSWKKN